MKEIFENAELEIVELSAESIILDSTCTGYNTAGCDGDGEVVGCDIY